MATSYSAKIPLTRHLVRDTRLFAEQINGVLQAAKHVVSRFGSLVVETQCHQGGRVVGITGEIETSLKAEIFASGNIDKSGSEAYKQRKITPFVSPKEKKLSRYS